MNRKKYIYLAALLIIVVVVLASRLTSGELYMVKAVIDGDTIALSGSEFRVRYLGIDAPEILTGSSPGEPLGESARKLNSEMVLGKKVRLERDIEKFDKYGRMLAYVYVDDVLVNEVLVREGLAEVLFIDPNKKYLTRFQSAEENAQKEQKGIWNKKARFTPPALNEQYVIEPSKAADFIGEKVVVRGSVEGARENRHVIALRLKGGLDVVIFRRDLPSFAFFDIEPKTFYKDKRVEAIGRVSLYKGRPQIIVNHPIGLMVIE